MLFVGLFLAAPNSVWAQSDPLELQWSKTYHEYGFASVFQTFDGGFLIAGSNLTSFPEYLTLIKINSDGEMEWRKTYSEITWVPALMYETDSSYLLLHDNLATYGIVNLLKVEFQGNFEWSKSLFFGRSQAFTQYVRGLFDVDATSCVLSIFESDARGGGYRSRFMCYDVYNEVLLWTKSIEGVRVAVVLPFGSDEGYYVAGSQDKQPWFAKLNSNYEIIWSRTYDTLSSSGLSGVSSVIPTIDGGFLLGGFLSGSGGVSFVVKTDGDGMGVWRWKHDSLIYDGVEIERGQYLVFSSSDLICVSASGKVLWVEPFSKYLEDPVSLANFTYVRGVVSAFVGEGDSVVVAIPFGVSGDYTSCLWVASFVVKSSSSVVVNSSSIDYAGVVCVVGVGVGVFVGVLTYLKKRYRLNSV